MIYLCVISGCASAPAYKEVFEEKPAYNSREFSVGADALHQATVRALCSRNFIIEKEDADNGFILARRSFQKGKRTFILALQAKINSQGEDNSSSVLYLNALQTTERLYVADRTRFFLFIVPLPGGGGKEATKIKEEEKTIEDREFYQKFFSAVEVEIAGEQKS